MMMNMISSSLRIGPKVSPAQFRSFLSAASNTKSTCIQQKHVTCRRHLSSSSATRLPDLDYIQKYYTIHSAENTENGSKEYLLLPPEASIQDAKLDTSLKLAALYRHRNIIFAARTFQEQYALSDICLPLVEVALKEAGENGDQPQAIASLAGLSEWVNSCLTAEHESTELEKLQQNDPVTFEAVEAIATGVPRKDHSVVGIGTYRDAEQGWKLLAREFVERKHAEEVNLYEKRGAKLVEIEHMADQSPAYLQSAGGAMARLFFL
jgi:hypothetical protein